jgi:predicted DNA-binding transcriptional regulator AlpA
MPKTNISGTTEPQSFDYLRAPDAARYIGISESTLAKMRMRHNRLNGPKFRKISGCVIYRRDELDIWLDQHLVGT